MISLRLNIRSFLLLPPALMLYLHSSRAQDTIMYRGGQQDGYQTAGQVTFTPAYKTHFAMYGGSWGDGYGVSTLDNFLPAPLTKSSMYHGGSAQGYSFSAQGGFTPAPLLHHSIYMAGSGDGFASASQADFSPHFLPHFTMYTASADGDDGYAGSLVISYAPLPLQLLAFTGQAIDRQRAELSWEVADENGLMAYELQKSKDGASFRKLHTQAVPDGAAGPGSYSYIDQEPYSGHNFYRLLISERNGKASYSRIVMLSFDETGHTYTLFPNPSASNIQIRYDILTPAVYTIYDIRGSLRASGNMAAGRHTLALPVDQYPAGSYLLRIQHEDGSVKVISFVKVR